MGRGEGVTLPYVIVPLTKETVKVEELLNGLGLCQKKPNNNKNVYLTHPKTKILNFSKTCHNLWGKGVLRIEVVTFSMGIL